MEYMQGYAGADPTAVNLALTYAEQEFGLTKEEYVRLYNALTQ